MKKSYLLVIFIIAVVLYAWTLNFPYQYDDGNNFIHNPGVHDIGVMYGGRQRLHVLGVNPNFYHHYRVRALPYLSFWANYKLGGLEARWQWRLVNIVLHGVMSSMVCLLVVMLFRMPKLSGAWEDGTVWRAGFAAALVYAVHPLMAETVIYVSGRVGQLSAVIYLGALLCYLKWAADGKKLAAVGFFLLGLSAMFSKETAFTLPLAAALTELIFGEGRGWRRWRMAVWGLALLPVIPVSKGLVGGEGFLGGIAEGSRLLSGIPREQYLYAQFDVVVRYLRMIFLPTGQSAHHVVEMPMSPLNPRTILSLLALVGVFGTGVYMWRKSARHPDLKVGAYGIFGFFLALSVESSVFPVIVPMVEYRTYLPMAFLVPGVIVSVVGGLNRVVRTKAAALAASVILLLAAATVARSYDWRSQKSLWEAAYKSYPHSVRTNVMYGEALCSIGRCEEGIKYLEAAVRLKPDNLLARDTLGRAYLSTGRPDLAQMLLKR